MKIILGLKQNLGQLLLVSGLVVITIAMNGCDAIYLNEDASLTKTRQKGEVVVLTTTSPLTYNMSKRGETSGIDNDMMQSFSDYYKLPVRFVVLPDEDSVLRALSKGEGDVAAARLRTPDIHSGFLTGPTYEETSLNLFCTKKSHISNIQDLNDKKIALLKKDNYDDLPLRITQLAPKAELQVVESQKTQDLFYDLSSKKYDCVMAENFVGDFYIRYYPSLEKVSGLAEKYSLSWIVNPNNQDLLLLMQAWYQRASREDEIMRIQDHYKGSLEELSSHDISHFFSRIRHILPHYRQIFKQAASENELPWQLVASVAYQESQWDAEARSITGVRGLMQLTEDTADRVGVEDRTDPAQSIWGGSKYLRELMDKLPDSINAKDRLALALAAYNMGYAHLRDAQKLAESMGKNPYSWHHLREVLPLLEKPAYEARLEYGSAHGTEAVDFVERVRSFYSLMTSAG